MKTNRAALGLVAATLVLGGGTALAQFSGYFSGYYAPANWTKVVGGNALYQSSGFIYTGGAPNSVEIDGAISSQQQVTGPQLPLSVIDYTIVLGGTGLQPIAFGYLFTGLADGYDSAELLYYNGSDVQETVSLSSLIGVQQTYSGQALGGQTLDFRVYSNNDTMADTLTISAVPEPSALALLGLGLGALLLRLPHRIA